MTAERLVRLYPPAWRDRYAEEFVAAVGSGPLHVQQIVDIVSGAIDAWLSSDVRRATVAAAGVRKGGRGMDSYSFVCSDSKLRYTQRDAWIGAGVLILVVVVFSALDIAARRSGLPRATVLGSIVLDQLVNAVGLFVGIAALPFVLEMPGWLHSGLWLAVLLFLVVSALVFVFQPRAGQPTLAGAQPQGRAGAVAGFLARARLGLAAVRDRRALARSAGASLLAWLVEINVVLITLHAFGLHPSLGVSLLVLMAVNLALVVPFAPPGNLGTLEVGAMLALMQYGVPKEKALAFALVYHLLQVVPIGIAGLSLAGQSLIRPSSATPGRPASSPTN